METDAAAKKLGIRVISPDRPGFGLSTYQENRKLLDWPNDVCELADQLHIKKFAVLGVSGGAPYAAACAYKIPERLTRIGIVVGLAPVSIPGNLDGVAFINRLGWNNYHNFPIVRTFSAFASQLQYKQFPILAKIFAFQAKEDKEILKSRKSFAAASEAFRQGVKGAEKDLQIYTDDWGFNLNDIETKVYLWYEAKDKNVSLNMGKYYHSQISNSELFIDSFGGHLARYNYEEKILKRLT
jgi:pimeloyl-ACP methyl ester carboxylesterase